jgi:FtsH-binding integral membrane protein
MANWQDPQTTGVRAATVSVPRAARDVGLRSYMLSVYNYMASGVLLTGIVALLLVNSPLISFVFDTATGRPTLLPIIAFFVAFGLQIWLQAGLNRMSIGTAKALFFAYAALLGVALCTIFIAYTGVSIAQTFFATAAAFASLSLWGYTTKKDLSGWGSFLIMGVVGIIVAIVINMFLQSTALNLAISAIGVLLFAGLTAYDSQKIKSIYFTVAGNGEAVAKTAVIGALQLYLDFINMFLFLLRFMGNRR